MVRMAVAINGVRKLFIWNAPPLRLASFRNQRERARKIEGGADRTYKAGEVLTESPDVPSG